MDAHKQFQEALKKGAAFFSLFSSFKLVSHIDCDGVSATASVVAICNHLKKPYSLYRTREITPQTIADLKQAKEQAIVFIDMGSVLRSTLAKELHPNQLLLIDHHHLQDKEEGDNVVEVNPKRYGLNDRREISSAGIAYLIAKEVTKKRGLAPLALLGAIGDAQEDQGFTGLNKEILEQAIKDKEIEAKPTIRLFGRQSRPLSTAIEYSQDIPMQGLTNNAVGVRKLLAHLDIVLQHNGVWRTLADLSPDEEQRLTEALMDHMDPKTRKIATWISYTLLDRPKGSPTRDLREFATLLNACGRLDDIELGIAICLGDEQAMKKAQAQLAQYKDVISQAKHYVDDHPECITKKEGILIIDGKEHIPADVAGTLASIFTRSRIVVEGTIVCVLARSEDKTKISLRIHPAGKDVCALLTKIINKIGGSCGGHSNAAGGIIDSKKEDEFKEELLKEVR
ncbi:MAG TPA: DHH family phosphoesterase [Candidatus Nanoarchaeia archaeon]|nr:DHH family phosphoesterase [Candidatus Nanoarchaeia archaeon]